MMNHKKLTAGFVAAALCISLVVPSETQAAKKPKLSKTKITLSVKETKKVSIKNVKATKIKKLVVKSSKKKIATVKKNGKTAFSVTGKKAGNATITAKVQVKGKKSPTSLKLKVTVKKASDISQTQSDKTAAPVVTVAPTPTGTPASGSQNTPTPSPSTTPGSGDSGENVTPSASPSQIPETPKPAPENPQSILEAYSDIFPYLGNCANYGNGQLTDEKTSAFIKKHFNSFTLENEMKPSYVLGYSATKISKEQATKKGYTIPDNYTEDYVPQLNFDTLDKVLQVAYDNNLKMRGHTLVWHSQTPEWFFTKDYAGSTLVDIDTMDARLEFYVTTVMSHIMEKEKEITGEAGSIVYAWDITNEYLHHSFAGSAKTWTSIYKSLGNAQLKPPYVKKAYEIAYAQLEAYGVQDKVTLFYNDFDTYFNTQKVISLVNYINEGETDKDGNPVNICGGIGMQSHLDVDRPTIEEYQTALESFLATGLEVQITELDATINWNHTNTYTYQNENQTDEDQAAFIKDFMEMIISVQKNRDKATTKGITSLTIWGLNDSVSWRGGYQSGGNSAPTLFGTSIDDPKPSYTEFINAYKLWYK